VTILGKDNSVVTHLGDNPDPEKRAKNPIPPEQWVDGLFISPHGVRWDKDGNLYVEEWLSTGRITKLKRFARNRAAGLKCAAGCPACGKSHKRLASNQFKL
jgi:hypothetical protein